MGIMRRGNWCTIWCPMPSLGCRPGSAQRLRELHKGLHSAFLPLVSKRPRGFWHGPLLPRSLDELCVAQSYMCKPTQGIACGNIPAMMCIASWQAVHLWAQVMPTSASRQVLVLTWWCLTPHPSHYRRTWPACPSMTPSTWQCTQRRRHPPP